MMKIDEIYFFIPHFENNKLINFIIVILKFIKICKCKNKIRYKKFVHCRNCFNIKNTKIIINLGLNEPINIILPETDEEAIIKQNIMKNLYSNKNVLRY